MRIGLIIYNDLNTLSGGYLYDRMLVERLRRDGDHVEIISLPWRNYVRHLGDNLRQRALLDRCRALNLDLLLQDELNHPSLTWSNRWLRARLGVPLISIVHHLRADETHPAWLIPLYRAVESNYVNSVDGFIFNSHSTRRAVFRLLTRPRPHIVAWPAADHLNPPQTAKIANLVEQRSRDLGPLRVLAVGNVIGRKNLHTLIDALARLPAEKWSLVIAGGLSVDPAYVRRLQRRIARRGLNQSFGAAPQAAPLAPQPWGEGSADPVKPTKASPRIGGRGADQPHRPFQQPGHVHFTGPVDAEGLRQLYAASHIMALPSYEGFGIVYLEAMAYGVIPVASTRGAAGEIIHDDVDGYLIHPEDASELARQLQGLYANRERLAQMGAAARRRFDIHPTWDESMAKVSRWLHEFMRERRS